MDCSAHFQFWGSLDFQMLLYSEADTDFALFLHPEREGKLKSFRRPSSVHWSRCSFREDGKPRGFHKPLRFQTQPEDFVFQLVAPCLVCPVYHGREPDPSDSLPLSFPTVGGEIPLDMRLGGGQLVSEELMNLGESFIQTNDPSLKLFQCAVCNKFTTDNLDMLGLHMNVERSLSEDEWKAVMGDSYQCKLCRYNTQLKANFQLHCKTDKHVQKYQLVAHIKEGGKANEWRLKCVAIGNPVHLKCNACDYYTNSLEKLRLHTVNSRHEASLKLYKVRWAP